MLSSESDSLASGDWDNVVTAFLYDRHFWTLFFLIIEKVILTQIIKNLMASSFNET